MEKAGKVLAEHEEKVASEAKSDAKAEESALADTSATEKSVEGVAPVVVVERSAEPVSYTHLTLPTICSV